MNSDYRTQELAEATEQSAAARHTYNTATTAKARREAAEALEFWSSKTAFLANAR